MFTASGVRLASGLSDTCKPCEVCGGLLRFGLYQNVSGLSRTFFLEIFWKSSCLPCVACFCVPCLATWTLYHTNSIFVYWHFVQETNEKMGRICVKCRTAPARTRVYIIYIFCFNTLAKWSFPDPGWGGIFWEWKFLEWAGQLCLEI